MPKMLCASGISIEKTVKEAIFFLNTRNLSTRFSHQFSGLRSKGKLFLCQRVWSLGRVLFVCSSSVRHAGYRVISYFIARLSTADFALEGEVGVGEIN